MTIRGPAELRNLLNSVDSFENVDQRHEHSFIFDQFWHKKHFTEEYKLKYFTFIFIHEVFKARIRLILFPSSAADCRLYSCSTNRIQSYIIWYFGSESC